MIVQGAWRTDRKIRAVWRIAYIMIRCGVLFCSFGCRESSQLGLPWDPQGSHRVLLETFQQTAAEKLFDHVHQNLLQRYTVEILREEVQHPWNQRVYQGGIKYADLFLPLYETREVTSSFVLWQGLSPRGESVVRALEQASYHVLPGQMYHPQAIQKLRQSIASQTEQHTVQQRRFQLQPQDVEKLLVWEF